MILLKIIGKKKPLLLCDRKAEGYKDLLTLNDFDSLLFSHAARPFVRLVNNKRMLNVDDYISQECKFLNRHKLLSDYKEGTTISLGKLETRYAPMKKLCQEFEKILGHPNRTETFLTPPHSQGFRAHYDSENVFILQLGGQKRWKIYDILIPFPLESSDTPYDGELPKPTWEIDLQPGDFLYLPRGYVHEAATTTDYSLHITMVIHVFTWLDLIYEALKQKPEFRKALPIGSLFSLSSEVLPLDNVQSVGEIFRDRDNMELAFKKIKGKFTKKMQPAFNDSFTSFSPVQTLPHTLLKKREGMLCSLITENDQTAIHFGEEVITGPSYIEPALQYIVDVPHFSINTMPDTLSTEGNTVLVKSLIRAGLIVEVDARQHAN